VEIVEAVAWIMLTVTHVKKEIKRQK